MVLNSIVDFLFNWTTEFGPLWGVIIVAGIITLITTLVYKYFTDQKALKKIKEDHKDLQEEMKKHKENPAKMAELQKQLLQKGLIEPMKHQLKPLLITFIPFILIFGWLKTTYQSSGDMLFGFGWFGTYIIFSIIFSIILRKV